MLKRREFLKNMSLGASWLAVPNLSHRLSEGLQISNHPWKNIPIVDTHVHFWELDRLEYPWLEDKESPLSRDFRMEDYRQATQEYSVDKIVFVESGRAAHQYQEEIDWVTQLAQQYDLIGAMVAYFPLHQSSEKLEQLASHPLVVGIRSMGNVQGQVTSSVYRTNLAKLSEYNLSLDIHLGPTDFDDYLPLIDQYPNLTFVLNHLGLPDVKNEAFEAWQTGIQKLAERPNVVCKLSGLLTRCHPEQMNSHSLKKYVITPIEQFGIKRVVFGSDWPVLTRAASFDQWLSLLEKMLNGLSQDELKQLFSENARRVYRIA